MVQELQIKKKRITILNTCQKLNNRTNNFQKITKEINIILNKIQELNFNKRVEEEHEEDIARKAVIVVVTSNTISEEVIIMIIIVAARTNLVGKE